VSLEIHSLLRDRYRIKEKLAQSGMGTIYLAHDEVLNVDIAIKENLYTTEGHSRQFRQEATILAKLRHPNLPRVIDHFVIEDAGEYLVMDYIEGQDLSEYLEHKGEPLPEEAVVRIGAVICEALDYLHSRTPPIIHRDIKPANLKITPGGHVILVDFGLAKLYEQGEMTAIGAQGITAGYSPVEQYGQGTDARSDIYALGATLYTLLTNQVPPEALERAIGQDNLITIEQFNADVAQPIQDVIAQAMAMGADDRFQDAKAFQDALLEAHPLPDFSPSQPVVPPASIESNHAPKPLTTEPTLRAPKKKVRVWMRLILLLVVLGAATAAVVLIFGNGGPFNPGPAVEPSATQVADIVIVDDHPTNTPTQLPPTHTETAPASSPTITPTLPPQGTPQGGGQGQIAFVSERSGSPQIYLMNSDGSGVEQLTSEPEGACQPDWAPGGMYLAYISPCDGMRDRYDGASIFVLNLETGRSDLISTLASGDYDPAWSPDGKRLAFTSLQTGKPQIFIYEFDTSESHLLMNRSTVNRMPEWSPDGSQILFVSPSPVTNRPILFIVDAQGQQEPRGVLGQNYEEAYRPTWSPEGDLIVFDLGGEPQLGGRLFASNQDVPINTQLVIAENPAFSEDAKWLVCDGVLDDPGRDIFLMLRTGARLTRLTDNPADDYQPVWRP